MEVLERELRYSLQVRKNRVLKADSMVLVDELILFFDFLRKNPKLHGLLKELHQTMPNFDEWYKKMESSRRIVLPDTEEERVKVCLAFLEHCMGTKNEHEPMSIALSCGCSEKGYEGMTNFFLEHFFMPFYEYLDERIEEYSSVLYILERFKLRTNFFNRQELFRLYSEDIPRGEKILEQTLRQYLFDQGINYPFSTPLSSSGRADVVANLHTIEPLIIEIKIFNPDKGYDRSYIRRGFRQVRDYITDYNKTVGYLVIFNTSNRDLQFKLKSSEVPLRVGLGDKVIYLIVIDIFPYEHPASKRGPVEPYIIEEAYLTSTQQ